MIAETWAGVPRVVRALVAFPAAVLAYGGVVHLVQVARGGAAAYDWAPAWLAVYFTCLTVADPLAAGLLVARRRSGWRLGTAVLITDAAANAYATYGSNDGDLATRIAPLVIGLIALFMVGTTPRVLPWLSTPTRPGSDGGPWLVSWFRRTLGR